MKQNFFKMNQKSHYLYIQLLMLTFFHLYDFQLTIQNVDITYNNTGTISNFILRLPIKEISDQKNVWLGFGFNSQRKMVRELQCLNIKIIILLDKKRIKQMLSFVNQQ
jgi:hypothetical protein